MADNRLTPASAPLTTRHSCATLGGMVCPECGSRKARRHCPARGHGICPTCCGTKRLVEIPCPPTCAWLRAAQAHPTAARQRREARDRDLLLPLLDGLSDAEYAVLSAALEAAMSFRAHALPPPLDEDLEQAAGAAAATAETAMRGLIYEHQPSSVVASRLLTAMRDATRQASGSSAPRAKEAATAVALRRLERTVRASRHSVPAEPTAFWEFLGRVLQPRMAGAGHGVPLTDATITHAVSADDPPEPPRIILP